MQSTTDGGWNNVCSAFTPEFDRTADRNLEPVTIGWKMRYPTDYNGSWRECNKTWLSVCDEDGELLYTLLFKPNRQQDRYTSYDLRLYKHSNGEKTALADGWTHTLTPHSDNAEWVEFKMQFNPDSTITVKYDAADGNGMVKYIEARDGEFTRFEKLRLEYYTCTGQKNYFSQVDNIRVYNGGYETNPVGVADVSPVLERVEDNCDGTHTAYFGYFNPNGYEITIPVNGENGFHYQGSAELNLGQVTVFSPGRTVNAFSVVFDGTNLVWSLSGHTATASGSAANPECQ